MRRIIHLFLLTAGLLLVPATAVLAQAYTYTIGGLVGIGGSLDETDAGFGHPTWQAGGLPYPG